MANIKQQKKRIRTDQARNLRNKSFKSKLKTAYKKAIGAIDQVSTEQKTVVKAVIKLLDQAKARKIKHRNYVDRKKSQLHKYINYVEARRAKPQGTEKPNATTLQKEK